MASRFYYNEGTLSVANGASTVTFTGAALSGVDWEAAQIWYHPPGSPVGAMQLIGIVAPIVPRGEYEDLELPIEEAYTGESLTDANYFIVMGPAIANGAVQAAIYARFAAHLEQNMGLVGNTADDVNFDLVPENSLFVDDASRVIYQWRDGVLNEVYTVGLSFNPLGTYDDETTYNTNDLVEYSGNLFVSNVDTNLGNTPGGSPFPTSDSNWTLVPMPSVATVLTALGVNSITISTDPPSGGVDTDLWLQVS